MDENVFPTFVCVCMSEGARALLTTVLDVERELEGLLELMVGAGGSLLQNHREFSESSQAHRLNNINLDWKNTARM